MVCITEIRTSPPVFVGAEGIIVGPSTSKKYPEYIAVKFDERHRPINIKLTKLEKLPRVANFFLVFLGLETYLEIENPTVRNK